MAGAFFFLPLIGGRGFVDGRSDCYPRDRYRTSMCHSGGRTTPLILIREARTGVRDCPCTIRIRCRWRTRVRRRRLRSDRPASATHQLKRKVNIVLAPSIKADGHCGLGQRDEAKGVAKIVPDSGNSRLEVSPPQDSTPWITGGCIGAWRRCGRWFRRSLPRRQRTPANAPPPRPPPQSPPAPCEYSSHQPPPADPPP